MAGQGDRSLVPGSKASRMKWDGGGTGGQVRCPILPGLSFDFILK
jgi:hypothetical protein